MMNLTIKGFLNEMSYKNSMEELENIVVDYQNVLIDYFINNQYSFKAKKEFNEVCEILRRDDYFTTIFSLVNNDDPRIKPDMAYVMYTSTNFNYVDQELKNKSLQLGYTLREGELGSVVNDVPTNTCILIASVKAIRSYMTTPFIRSKFVENILSTLPEILYNAYGNKYKASELPTSAIFVILTKAVIDLTPSEIISAFCKTEFPDNADKEIKEFALRLRSFLYDLCGRVGDKQLNDSLFMACKSLSKFNDRTSSNETFNNKYLNYRLLEVIVKSGLKGELKVPTNMQNAYNIIKRFKLNNPRFEKLF